MNKRHDQALLCKKTCVRVVRRSNKIMREWPGHILDLDLTVTFIQDFEHGRSHESSKTWKEMVKVVRREMQDDASKRRASFTSERHPSHVFRWRRIESADQIDGEFSVGFFHRLLLFQKLAQAVGGHGRRIVFRVPINGKLFMITGFGRSVVISFTFGRESRFRAGRVATGKTG